MAPPKLVIISLLLVLGACFTICDGRRAKKTNGMFVFGSSLVDNGNNNFLQNSMAKADYLPYGIDFPLGPSGRFTNGKNVIDLLGDYLELPSFIPPFSDPSTKGIRIVHGVNYASAASGILDDTGSIAGDVINLNQQIRNFEEVSLVDLRRQWGCKSNESLSKYLFVLGTGGNDYSFNYFLRGLNANVTLQLFTANLISALSRQIKKLGDLETQLGIKSQESLPNYLFVLGSGGNDYSFNYFLKSKLNPHLSLQDFTSNLISTYYTQIKRLYDLGGRKFVLMSVNPLGCYPMVMTIHPTNIGCNQALNRAAHLFNENLRTLGHRLKQQMPGSNLVFVNSYKIIRQIIRDPLSNGFKDAERPCCVVPTLNEGGNGSLCKRGGKTCKNRNNHVFFDGLHPTEGVNVVIARKAFSSNLTSEVYPINIQHLLEL